jgi:hypothetical protein
MCQDHLIKHLQEEKRRMHTLSKSRATTLALRSTWGIVFLVVVLLVVVTPTTRAEQPQFLFIGNSYTDANNLQGIFAKVLHDGGGIDNNKAYPYTESVDPAGYDFNQHYGNYLDEDDGNLNTKLAPAAENQREWNWVVLQDQSQVPGLYQSADDPSSDYALSLDGAIGLNNAIRQAGAQTMFFMTWGRENGDRQKPEIFPDFLTMQKHLTRGYKRFQRATSTRERPTYIAPVGLVFRTVYKSTKNGGTLFSNLYMQDGSHPSLLGSYVAALTIYSSITGMDPTIIDYWPDSITESTARDVQNAVKRTLLRTKRNGSIKYPWTSMTTRNRRRRV